MSFIPRQLSNKVNEAHLYFPVTLITGPRQSGKTTLCKHLFPEYNFVNLEVITAQRRAIDDPEGFIASLGSNVIIDEAHRVPEILSVIQANVDENPELRYVLTGSSNFALMSSISQSLAGRVAVFTLLPLSLSEIPAQHLSQATDAILFSGLYPGVIANNNPVDLFYESYFSTYIERDLRDLLKVKNLNRFEHFIRLCAGRASTEFNMSALATEVGVSSPTIADWLSILAASYICFTVHPYYANIGKRLTKKPKLFFYDTGLMTYLLGISDAKQIATHPLRGAIFENLIMSEMVKQSYNKARRPTLYFYRENSGKEVDIVEETASGLRLFEVKSAMTYRSEFMANISYLKEKLGTKITDCSLIYDGESIAPDLYNFRTFFGKS
ncbi:ATP-binding protein [Parabacteroides sp. ZJ-118]|uniref:ATP-binding protein n=1 Tax=Parabacteroides sp. ZJ-118 TaxID=2709398 RepID=UPI0013EE036D|nr:ATP-binding protein [Parabacteroides sp. ZJ-118]